MKQGKQIVNLFTAKPSITYGKTTWQWPPWWCVISNLMPQLFYTSYCLPRVVGPQASLGVPLVCSQPGWDQLPVIFLKHFLT